MCGDAMQTTPRDHGETGVDEEREEEAFPVRVAPQRLTERLLDRLLLQDTNMHNCDVTLTAAGCAWQYSLDYAVSTSHKQDKVRLGLPHIYQRKSQVNNMNAST